jgi:lysophospholipase L1-like esterase
MPTSRRPFTLPAAVTALAVAVVAAGAVARTRGPEARRARTWEAALEAARRAEVAPRQRWGAPLRPAPLVSRGKPVAASRSGAEVLVDGVYRDRSWAGGIPAAGAPVWAAIRIGRGPTRLLLSWTSSHNHDYREQFYGAPVDYRIETSADSTDGKDGTWRTAVDVRDNPVRSRAHAFAFGGQLWVRLVVTRLPERRNEWGLFLDEIDVHDLSLGGDDVWVFLGDSIDAGVFDRAPTHRPGFTDLVAKAHPGYEPAVVDAGFCAARSGEVLARIDDVLAWNPDARVFAITLGSNDPDAETLRRDLDAIVARIEAAGRIAVVSRLPYQTKYERDFVAPKNRAIDGLTAARALLPGPDLDGWFRARPERLEDGLHPDAEGSRAMIRLWAEAVAPLYPRD